MRQRNVEFKSNVENKESEHIGYFSDISSVANANPKKLHNQISQTTTYSNPKLVVYVLFESFRVYVIYTDVDRLTMVWNDSYLALTALPAKSQSPKTEWAKANV